MSDIFERILLLKHSPVFGRVATEDLRVVARELEEEAYFAGERVFDIEEEGDHVYFIETGRIGISIQPDPARREFVAELGPGECFGEMNLFDNLPRSATAHVLEDSKILSLDKAKLHGLLMRYPALALGLLRGLSMRLRQANRRVGANKTTEN